MLLLYHGLDCLLLPFAGCLLLGLRTGELRPLLLVWYGSAGMLWRSAGSAVAGLET
jgi:hypothetical protein